MRDTVETGQPHIYLRYGLGLGVSEVACGVTLRGHTGGLPGFATHVTRADDGRQLSVSVNPLTQRLSREELTSLYETVYCDG